MSRKLVLNFHGLGEMPSHVGSSEARHWCQDISVFRALLADLEDVETVSHLPIEITFDDGNISDLTFALPELLRAGRKASFFVCAGRIGSEHYLGRSDILELINSGMTVGSHGWAHRDWRQCSEPEMAQEIDQACDVISQIVGNPVTSTAIPFGSYDRRVLARIDRFELLYTSDGGLARSGSRRIPRESWTTDWGGAALSSIVASRRSPFTSIRKHISMAIKGLR